MVHTKLISASIFAAFLASAGTALAASPAPMQKALVQAASTATRLAMVTNDNGAYTPASAGSADHANAQLCGNTVTSSAPRSKPTFRRPSFMNWSWYAMHGHGN